MSNVVTLAIGLRKRIHEQVKQLKELGYTHSDFPDLYVKTLDETYRLVAMYTDEDFKTSMYVDAMRVHGIHVVKSNDIVAEIKSLKPAEPLGFIDSIFDKTRKFLGGGYGINYMQLTLGHPRSKLAPGWGGGYRSASHAIKTEKEYLRKLETKGNTHVNVHHFN